MNPFLDRLQRQAVWLCLCGGALVTLSLAPFNLWLVGPLAIALLAIATHRQDARRTFWLAWLFGVGLFGSGASWVYVSIHDHGDASFWLASLLTTLFVCSVALVFALPFLIYGKWFSRHRENLTLALPAIWVLGEWFRSWILTGFPWLFLGYAHISTPLAGWFPVTGVWGASFVVAYAGGALAGYAINQRLGPLLYTLVCCIAGYGLQQIPLVG